MLVLFCFGRDGEGGRTSEVAILAGIVVVLLVQMWWLLYVELFLVQEGSRRPWEKDVSVGSAQGRWVIKEVISSATAGRSKRRQQRGVRSRRGLTQPCLPPIAFSTCHAAELASHRAYFVAASLGLLHWMFS